MPCRVGRPSQAWCWSEGSGAAADGGGGLVAAVADGSGQHTGAAARPLALVCDLDFDLCLTCCMSALPATSILCVIHQASRCGGRRAAAAAVTAAAEAQSMF